MSYLISIIIPCYNQEAYLGDCLTSIENQTYKNWECLIINDGSTDTTEQTALKWTRKDSRFKYYYKNNGGLSSARNYGLDKISGEYIQFLDCDDFIDREKFGFLMNEIQSNPVDLILSNFEMYNKKRGFHEPYCTLGHNLFNYKNILARWDISFTIPIHCCLFRSNTIPKNGFKTDLKAKEDWVFWLEVFVKNPSIYWTDSVFNFYRTHLESMTNNLLQMLDNTCIANTYIMQNIDKKHINMFVRAVHLRYMKTINAQISELEELKYYRENPGWKRMLQRWRRSVKKRYYRYTQELKRMLQRWKRSIKKRL